MNNTQELKDLIALFEEKQTFFKDNNMSFRELIVIIFNPSSYELVDNTNLQDNLETIYKNLDPTEKTNAVFWWNSKTDKSRYPYISNADENKELVINAIQQYRVSLND